MNMTEALSLAIQKWEESSGRRNLSLLKRLTGVSYSTLRRVKQNETDITIENALKVAEVVMDDAAFQDFTERYMPSVAKTRVGVAVKSVDDEMLEFMKDKALIPIFLLATHRLGTNGAEVRDFYGREAERKFNELVNSGHLAMVRGGNWKLDRPLGSVSLETAREWLVAMAAICPVENDSINRASLAHVGWESVNFETAVAVYHAALDFVRKTVTLTRDERNKGDILIIFGSLFNVLKGTEEYR